MRTVDDTNVPGTCPNCDSRQYTINRCDRCGLDDLEDARAHSNAGRLFERLLELEFGAQHFSIPWTDVTAEELRGPDPERGTGSVLRRAGVEIQCSSGVNLARRLNS